MLHDFRKLVKVIDDAEMLHEGSYDSRTDIFDLSEKDAFEQAAVMHGISHESGYLMYLALRNIKLKG